MSQKKSHDANAVSTAPRRLCYYNGGFLTQRSIRRILQLSGYELHLGFPREGDQVAVWGQAGTAHRGEAIARRFNLPLVRIEDAFWRSLHPARAQKSPPLGLMIDAKGVHFDPSKPSALEELLKTHPLEDPALLECARGLIARMKEAHLSKYTAFDLTAPLPPAGYVLLIDQTYGDAAVRASKADRDRFLKMLFAAQKEHPRTPIVIKTHPETAKGVRGGYFNSVDATENITFFDKPVSPWALFEGAVAVYAVSSQMGFEAIFAGHRPRIFGQPFYAGWGLTQDEYPVARRQRQLTPAQLFAASMLLFPKWYDPYNDRLASAEEAAEALNAQTRAWREDHKGWIASDMRLWKRAPLQKTFGAHKRMRFENDPAKAATSGRPWMVWASKAGPAHEGAHRLEDGFLRSRGLGAELVPALSLVKDDLGIYYDPSSPSRLEALIASRAQLRPDQQRRIARLIETLTQGGISKYNLEAPAVQLPAGEKILVVGQVEDDASIRCGALGIKTNRALLQAARTAHPKAHVIYKPHPDVEAGLRQGAILADDLADQVLNTADISAVLMQVDRLWTMTSLTGFEALLRGVPVTCAGVPFYAGWGLSTDLLETPARRRPAVSLYSLAHAALIDYPRYFDPKTGLPCPVEVAVQRLMHADIPAAGPLNRLLAKLQGAFASYAHLWR